MLNGEVARYRTDDLLRTAEARRIGRSVVQRRRAARATRVRRLVTIAVTLLPVSPRR
jgi:hypothetical protein